MKSAKKDMNESIEKNEQAKERIMGQDFNDTFRKS